MNEIKMSLENSNYRNIIFLSLLILGGFFIRVIFLPWDSPLTLDSFGYFLYAYSTTVNGFPNGEYIGVNYSWPSFVSLFFNIAKHAEMLDLMNLQRIIGVLISVFTIIPIFKTSRIFFDNKISILISCIFIFEPHIVENSLFGGTESLFIMLISLTLFCVLSKKTNFYIFGFIFGALASTVRYEGFLLIIPLISAMFLKDKVTKLTFFRVSIGIVVFFLIVITYTLIFDEFNSTESIFYQIYAGERFLTTNIHSDNLIPEEKFSSIEKNNRLGIFVIDSVTGYSKFLLLVLIPIIGPILLLSLLVIPKKIGRYKIIIFIFAAIQSISGFYAYGRGIEDSRYIIPLIPVMVLVAGLGIKVLIKKFELKKFSVFFIGVIIVSSYLYVDFQSKNYQEENEIYNVALYVAKNADGVNEDPGGRFLKIAEVGVNWPRLPPIDERGKMELNVEKIPLDNFTNIQEYLIQSNNTKLTHIVVHDKNDKDFLNNVFFNEEDYYYLHKVYDSENFVYVKRMKIFEIDYDELKNKTK